MGQKNLSHTWILVFLLNIPLLIISQEQQTYNGLFEIGKYKGEANYDYSVINNDTIRNGTFKFQSSNLEALLKQKDTSFSINGSFNKNYPNGAWVFRFNTFASNSKSKVKDYQYVVNVNGTQQIAKGNLKDGKPNGIWTYSVKSIKNSEIEKVIFSSSMDFENGIPQRNFKIENENKELVGRFLRNGVAHDIWTLYSDEVIGEAESWNFKEGILKLIQIQSNGEIDEIPIVSEANADTKIVLLDNNYLDILKLQLKIDDVLKIEQSDILNLLAKNNEYYQNINDVLLDVSTVSFLPELKVHVPYFPLDTSEVNSLRTIKESYKKSREISNLLLEDTQLTILKLSNNDVRLLEESVKTVTEDALNPIELIVQYYNKEILQYVSRKQLFAEIWSKGIPSLHIENNNLISLDKETNAYSLSKIEELSKETFKYLDSVQVILAKKINKQKRKQEAIDLEGKMIAQLKRLEQLETSQVDTLPVIYVQTLKKVRKNATEKLNKYSAIQDVEEKLNYARELTNCFDKLDQIGATIIQLPKQQEDIEQKYRDAIWNPFTATVMSTTVKKRITEAYNTILIPHFLQKIEQGLSCEDTTEWIDAVNTMHSRMLEMRNEDTKKLERKLKKENDPEVILQRFTMQIKNKEN